MSSSLDEKDCQSVVDFYPGLFNEGCPSLLDIGIGEGPLVLPLLAKGWSIIGYEKDPKSISYLNEKFKDQNLSIKQQDLNLIDLQSKKLDYHDKLVRDLSFVKNVTMISVAPFLNDAALCHLLFTLMDHAQVGTVFLFCCATRPQIKDLEESRKILALPQSYIASFFGPRTDMMTQTHELTNHNHLFNDMLIVKKL